MLQASLTPPLRPPMQWGLTHVAARDVLHIVGLFVLAFVASLAAVELTQETGRVAAIWPANGIVVATILRSGRMPLRFGAAGLAGMLAAFLILGDHPLMAVFYTSCNATEMALIIWSIRRFCPGASHDLSESNNLLLFALICLIIPILPAALAALVMDTADLAEWFDVIVSWYCADLLGLVTIVPLVVTLRSDHIDELTDPASRMQVVGLFAILAVVLTFSFLQAEHPRLFQIFPVLIFIAFRLGFAGATVAVAMTAVCAISALLFEIGPLNLMHGTARERIFVVQTFLALATLTSLQVAASLAERRRLKAALIESRDRAEAGSRAKADFLANMSHELRTPLTAVIGLSENMLRENAQHTPEQIRRFHEMQRDAGETLLGLITDILDFERIESGTVRIDKTSFAPDEVVEHCREMIVVVASRRNVGVETEFAADVPAWLMGDAFKIRQVLTNLLTNAVKFTPQDGRVTLTVSVSPAGDAIRYAVQDTGIGIAPEQLTTIFDRFSQAETSTSRRFGGSGLGLTISKRLAEAMGGRLEVESTPGVGSTFTLTLPLERDPENGVDAAANDDAPVITSVPRHLLLAEDNPVNQEILASMLRTAGHSVRVASDGVEAIAAFEQESFDLVLMDVQMPEVDGYAATRAIRAMEARTGRRTPILAVTANAVSGEADRCREAGMDDLVTKPVSWTQLFALIDTLTSRREAA